MLFQRFPPKEIYTIFFFKYMFLINGGRQFDIFFYFLAHLITYHVYLNPTNKRAQSKSNKERKKRKKKKKI